MDTVLIILLFVFGFLGWLSLFLGLPGTLVIWGSAALYALVRQFPSGDLHFLGILFIYVLFAEGLEFLVFYWKSKKAKLDHDVLGVGFLGGILGAFAGVPIPVFGSLAGLILGILSATFFYVYWKRGDWRRALRIAMVALSSRILSMLAKALVGMLMLMHLAFEIF